MAKMELNVPAYARAMDVLMAFYKMKNNKMKYVNLLVITHVNLEVYAYIKNNSLYLIDLENEWVFPLECFKGFRKIEKRISVPTWNKKESYKSDTYKKYKIKRSDEGIVTCKPYYAFDIQWHGEEFELFVPSYDFETMCSLLNFDPNVC